MARTHKQAVQSGVRFLDLYAPDWRGALRRSFNRVMDCGSGRLDLQCGICCVLGRLLPGFWRFERDEDRAYIFGQALSLGLTTTGPKHRARLNALWSAETDLPCRGANE